MHQLEIDGIARDLSHLSRFTVAVAGKGKAGDDLLVSVSFSRHTFSSGCVFGEHNMLDENNKPRIFCEDRYAFSLGLPELAKRMIEQNYFCWASNDRQRNINFAVIDVAPGRFRELKDGEHQTIFFYLYPDQQNPAIVNLRIVSCYMRYMIFRSRDRRYNLQTVLRKCLYEGKRIP
jgi:hypothetical protein